MKHTFVALGSALLLTSCAGVFVSNTQTAAVVTDRPNVIYIKPFSVEGVRFVGNHPGGEGERPIRESLAPAAFGENLREELEKLAPCRVLRSDEVAVQGWVVEGSIEEVDGGSRAARLFAPPLPPPTGRSHIKIHVRVRDLDHAPIASDSKDKGDVSRGHGHTIYEFDVAGGSRWTGHFGSVTAPSAGQSDWFDYRNAAERIRTALEVEPHRYGERVSPTIRQ